MKKTYHLPAMQVLNVRKTDILTNSNGITAGRPGYGSATTGNGKKSIWD